MIIFVGNDQRRVPKVFGWAFRFIQWHDNRFLNVRRPSWLQILWLYCVVHACKLTQSYTDRLGLNVFRSAAEIPSALSLRPKNVFTFSKFNWIKVINMLYFGHLSFRLHLGLINEHKKWMTKIHHHPWFVQNIARPKRVPETDLLFYDAFLWKEKVCWKKNGKRRFWSANPFHRNVWACKLLLLFMARLFVVLRKLKS